MNEVERQRYNWIENTIDDYENGVWSKEDLINLLVVREANDQRTEIKKHRAPCADCDDVSFNMFIINDDLWLTYCEKKEVLCIKCFTKRVGRTLTVADLKDVPMNDTLFAFYGN